MKKIIVVSSVLCLAALSACNLEIGTRKGDSAEVEKCYGIAKEGSNVEIYVQKGECEKIVNGSLEPKAS